MQKTHKQQIKVQNKTKRQADAFIQLENVLWCEKRMKTKQKNIFKILR